MTRRAHKVDGNQAEIVAALRAVGATVQILSAVGDGCPDILVGRNGRNYLMEIKVPGGKLTPDQVEWHCGWRGRARIVESKRDALKALGIK
jgi:hypothetical protein